MGAARLLFLIGLPGSGKSTLAAQLLQEDDRRRLISTDQIRAQLFGDEAIQGSWLLIWWEIRQQLTIAIAQIQAGIITEVIYDATNARRRDRRRALLLIRYCGFTQVTGIWVNTPLATCLERNQRRDRQVPEAVIMRMHARLVAAPPALEEGFDALIIR